MKCFAPVQWGARADVYGQNFPQKIDEPGMVVNPACGQLKRTHYIFSCPRSRLRIWSCETGSAVSPRRVSSLILHTLRLNLSLVLTWRISPAFRDGVHLLFIPTTAIGPVPSWSGDATAYRWCSLPRGRRRRTSSPQGSSGNGCCLFRFHHGSLVMRLSFPTTTIGM